MEGMVWLFLTSWELSRGPPTLNATIPPRNSRPFHRLALLRDKGERVIIPKNKASYWLGGKRAIGRVNAPYNFHDEDFLQINMKSNHESWITVDDSQSHSHHLHSNKISSQNPKSSLPIHGENLRLLLVALHFERAKKTRKKNPAASQSSKTLQRLPPETPQKVSLGDWWSLPQEINTKHIWGVWKICVLPIKHGGDVHMFHSLLLVCEKPQTKCSATCEFLFVGLICFKTTHADGLILNCPWKLATS